MLPLSHHKTIDIKTNDLYMHRPTYMDIWMQKIQLHTAVYSYLETTVFNSFWNRALKAPLLLLFFGGHEATGPAKKGQKHISTEKRQQGQPSPLLFLCFPATMFTVHLVTECRSTFTVCINSKKQRETSVAQWFVCASWRSAEIST